MPTFSSTLVAQKNGRSTIRASVWIRVRLLGASSNFSPIAESTWFEQLSLSLRFLEVSCNYNKLKYNVNCLSNVLFQTTSLLILIRNPERQTSTTSGPSSERVKPDRFYYFKLRIFRINLSSLSVVRQNIPGGSRWIVLASEQLGDRRKVRRNLSQVIVSNFLYD